MVVVALVAAALVLWVGVPAVPRMETTVFAALLVLVTLSGVTATDDVYAWTGTPVRHLGVGAWWLFGLMFVVGATLSNRHERLRQHDSRRLTLDGEMVQLTAISDDHRTDLDLVDDVRRVDLDPVEDVGRGDVDPVHVRRGVELDPVDDRRRVDLDPVEDVGGGDVDPVHVRRRVDRPWRDLRRVGSPNRVDADVTTSVAHGALVAAGVLAAYVVVEIVAGPPVDFASSSSRLAGPYGSPAYLGAACCLLLPIAVGVAVPRRSPRWLRTMSTCLVAVLAVALIGSGSRAAIVGVVAGGCAVGVAGLRRDVSGRPARPGSRRVRRSEASGQGGRPGPVAAFVAVIAVVVGAAGWAAVSGAFERSAGWATRLDEWRLALRVIGAQPWSGAGPEGYRIAAFGQIDDDYTVRYGESVLVDRAHSGVLDVAAASGVFAAAAYVVLLAVVVLAALRSVRGGRPAEIGIAVAIIAYAAQQQLLFPIAEIDPLFWLLAGVVVARNPSMSRDRSDASRASAVPDPLRSAAADVRLASSRVVAVMIVGLAIGATTFGVRAIAADRLARDATTVDDADDALALAEQARGLDRWDIRYAALVSSIGSRLGNLSGVDAGLDALGRALIVSPHDPATRLEQARLLALRAAITGTPDDRRHASIAWSALVTDAPSCARCHLGAGLAAAERGDLGTARDELRRAADLGSSAAELALDRLGEPTEE